MKDGPASRFSEASLSKKYLASSGVIYAAFALGICMTFLNATVLDFSHKLNETVDRVSIVFSVTTGSYLFGALSSGIVPKYIARELWAIFLLTSMAVPLFILPFVESVMMLCLLGAMVGFGGGGLDAAQSSCVIDIWRHDAPPFILMAQFAYSAGTLVPPLILGPYLRDEEENIGGTAATRSRSTEPPYESRLQIPFIIGGSIAILAVFIQTCVYIFVFRAAKSGNENQKPKPDFELETEEKQQTVTARSSNMKRKLLLVGLSCCVIGFYEGLEKCTGQFISTFSHFSKVSHSEKKSARIAFGLQMGFAYGRLCGMFVILKIAPHFLLTGNFALLLVSNVILLVWAGSNVAWLWVGSVMLGLGMSTVYGGMYSYLQKHVFVTDSIDSAICVSGGLISAIYTLIVGKWIEKNPQVLIHVNFLSILICAVAFSCLFCITQVKASRQPQEAEGTQARS